MEGESSPKESLPVKGPFWVGVLVLAGADYLSGQLALDFFASLNASASPVWPPTGIAIAGLLILGLRAWPAILVGAFGFNLVTSGQADSSAAIAVGNTLEAVLGAYLVRRFANGARAFHRVPDTVRFAALAGLVAPLVSATIGVSALVFTGLAPEVLFWPIWLTWWLGDAGGALLVAPAILLWTQGPWRLTRPLETLVMLACLVGAAALAFGGIPMSGRLAMLALVCLPLFLWPALRLGPRETATALLIVAAIAVWGTLRGSSPFPQPTTNDALLLLQVFLLVVAIATLTMAATRAEWGPRAKAPGRAGLFQSSAFMAITLIPLVIGTVVAGNLTANLTGHLADDRFDRHADDTAAALQRAVQENMDALLGLRALFESSTDVSRNEFETYVSSSEWTETHPGILGVHFVRFVADSERAAFEAERRSDPDLPAALRNNFTIHPTESGDAWVVDFIAPLQGSEAVLGLDLAFEADRRATIAATLASGNPAISPPLALVQDPERVGLLLVLALPPEADGTTAGLVDTSYFVDELVAAALAGSGASITLFDGTPDSDGSFNGQTPMYGDTDGAHLGPDARMRTLDIGGRTWSVVVARPVGLLTPIESYASWLVLGGAGILSFFFCTLVYTAANTGRHASALAETISEEARSGQRRLEQAQAIGHVGSWEWDIQANRIQWSDELYRLFGLQPNQFSATFEAYEVRLHPEDRAMVVARIGQAVADGKDFAFDHRIVRPDGTIRWLSSLGHVVQENGVSVRMLGTALDITDRRVLDDRFRSILEAAPDAVVMADRTGRIVLANRQAETMFGYPRNELLTRTIEDLVPPRLRAGHPAHRADFHANPKQRPMGVGLELFAVRKDGVEFPVEISLSPMDLDGGPVVVSTVRDVSDRKKAEALLAEGRRQLAVTEKLSALGTLVAGVGHEIRTPLTYIMTRLALVDLKLKAAAVERPELAALSTDVHAQTESAKQGVWRIDRIVQQLRGFSKAQLNAAPAQLPEVVQQAAELFRAAHKGQCELQVTLPDDLPPTSVDRGQIQQVLINLLNNAAEAMPQGGTIQVRTHADGDSVVLEVEDHGVGIPAEVQKRLFDPFFTTKAEGTGLGLSVSRRIVEAHGGTLTYTTQVDVGTTFSIRIPQQTGLPGTQPLPEGARP